MSSITNESGPAVYHAVSIARERDIPEIVALQSENQISRGGALSIEFPPVWFERAVADLPIVIARREGLLVGYLVSSSQQATQHLALSQAKYRAYPGSPTSYNSGPLCIAASERGQGLARRLFDTQRALLPGREGIAFVRRDNSTSRSVHARLGFHEVAQFNHAGIDYSVFAYSAPSIG